MELALLIFGTVFTSLCIWLTVRIINRRELWAKQTLAAVMGLPVLYVASFGPVRIVNRGERWAKLMLAGVIGLPLLYVASFGPACWVCAENEMGGKAMRCIYGPVIHLAGGSRKLFPSAIHWYANLGVPKTIEVRFLSGEIWIYNSFWDPSITRTSGRKL